MMAKSSAESIKNFFNLLILIDHLILRKVLTNNEENMFSIKNFIKKDGRNILNMLGSKFRYWIKI